MLTLKFLPGLLFLALSSGSAWSAASASNSPSGSIRDLNTPRDFPPIASAAEWRSRAQQIRQRVLVSCGLWPLSERPPVKPHIFGRIDRDGYSVERVYFETYPGFILGGNLYRPLGHGRGPFPAVLNPHGHWGNGRMADETDGSIAARCISFARQGMIAFSYDMVGYNDTQFADPATNRSFGVTHRLFGNAPSDQLWNISLMGLQTWNSLRALDFLCSLPETDPKRLACTGESGGGTQTFILGAIEDRLAVQAPIVMVSHSMQGGCTCENAPGLRVEFSNMEIAAAAAPRPQFLVAATGDWTKATLTVEGPAIKHIYELLGAADKFGYVRYDFGHNYNRTSREAVYSWFNRWLPKHPLAEPVKETPYQKEPDQDLRVFPDGKLPPGTLTREELAQSLRELHRRQWEALVPRNKSGLETYRKIELPAWHHSLQLTWPTPQPQVLTEPLSSAGRFHAARLRITQPVSGRTLGAVYWAPSDILTQRSPRVAILCGTDGDSQGQASSAAESTSSTPSAPALALLERGVAIIHVDRLPPVSTANPFTNFFTTYNRTVLQQRVGDLLTVCAAARSVDARKPLHFRVALCGAGEAGLWAALAAPAADAIVADLAGEDFHQQQPWLKPDRFSPGVLAFGGCEGVALLAAPRPVLWHNAGGIEACAPLRSAYHALKADTALRLESRRLTDGQLAEWIDQAL